MNWGGVYHLQVRVDGTHRKSRSGSALVSLELFPTINGVADWPGTIRSEALELATGPSICLAASPTDKPLPEQRLTIPKSEDSLHMRTRASAMTLGVKKSLTSSQLFKI
jgi:hypothetical protein